MARWPVFARSARGPQDLPAVGILLPLTIAAYVLLERCGRRMRCRRCARAGCRRCGLDTLFSLLWYWLLLAIARRRERYRADRHGAVRLADGARGAESWSCVWLMQRSSRDDSLRAAGVHRGARARCLDAAGDRAHPALGARAVAGIVPVRWRCCRCWSRNCCSSVYLAAGRVALCTFISSASAALSWAASPRSRAPPAIASPARTATSIRR